MSTLRNDYFESLLNKLSDEYVNLKVDEDELLEKVVEDARQDYRDAWNSYISEDD